MFNLKLGRDFVVDVERMIAPGAASGARCCSRCARASRNRRRHLALIHHIGDRAVVRVVRWSAQIVVAGVVLSCPPRAWCQGESAADPPITASQRVEWVVDGTLGLRSVTVFGPVAAGFQTGLNTPPEWTRSWFGFGRRYLERGVDVAMSSSIEAGLGAMSGEDPRYARLGHGRMRARAFYAVRTTFVARHGDGTWHPAWARYVANVANTMIENAWLPPSETTAGQTARRSIAGIVSRIGANALTEFWPDIAKRLHLSDSHAVTSRFD